MKQKITLPLHGNFSSATMAGSPSHSHSQGVLNTKTSSQTPKSAKVVNAAKVQATAAPDNSKAFNGIATEQILRILKK
jgi:hypothetical protein